MAPDGPGPVLTYDGFLLAGERWTGVVEGTVDRTFGADLLVQTERVNGAFPVVFDRYDWNGLPTVVGDISLERHPDTAEVKRMALGGTVEDRVYNNAFGEPASLTLRDLNFQALDISLERPNSV